MTELLNPLPNISDLVQDQEYFKTDSVQSSSNYLQKLCTKNLLTAR